MSYDWQKFRGVIPALLTPFNADGSLNETALRGLVGFLVDKGVSGFYINGSTAEGFLMNSEERMKTLEIVLDQVKRRVPVIDQIGTTQLFEALKMARHAERLDTEAISSVAPFYYSFRQDEIKEYYNIITGNCSLPLFIYNIPATTGISMSYDFIKEMSENPRIIGLKYTSHNHYDMQKIKELNGGRFVVFSGADEMCLSGLMAGANGLIGSFYNLVPELYIALVKHFENNEIDEARKLYAAGNDIIRTTLKYGGIPALKYALSLRGIDAGLARKPFRRLTDAEKKAVRDEFIEIENRRNTGLEFFKELA